MILSASYSVTAGVSYTLADFDGAGTYIRVIQPRDHTLAEKGRIKVSIDKTPMVLPPESFTLDAASTIVFSRDTIISTYKES